MRSIFILSLFFACNIFSFGQGVCFCDKDSLISESVSCDTITFSNKAHLYYQLNCDSVWLTLETPNKKKIVLFSMDMELAVYNYRLGYQLIKEFNNSLLFRYGCPANGPCDYVLVNKFTGKKEEKFHELIYNSEDKPTNFIIYFSDKSLNSLTIHNIDTKKKYKLSIQGSRFKNAPVAEQLFEDSEMKNNMLILRYSFPYSHGGERNTDSIIIDVNKYGGLTAAQKLKTAFTELQKNNSLANQRRFFILFPNSFVNFEHRFGYKDEKPAPLYSDSYQYVQVFFSLDKISKNEQIEKWINISIGGHWDADAINYFQESLRAGVLKNVDLTYAILKKKTDKEIESFFYFFFDEIHSQYETVPKQFEKFMGKDKKFYELLTRGHKRAIKNSGH